MTFTPLFCFTKAVAGEDANVLCLMTSTGPHGNQFSAKDMLKIREADILLCNGLGMDDQIVNTLVNSSGKKVEVIRLGEEIPHEMVLHAEEEPAAKDDKHDHEHQHGDCDPHLWLSPLHAMAMVDQIALALGKIDPAKKENFRKNAQAYQADLKQLQEYGLNKLKDKMKRNIVAQHDSLRYFAKAFHLEILGSIRQLAGMEKDPKDKANLEDLCKKHLAAAITCEPQYPKNEAIDLQKALQRSNMKVDLAEVDTLETALGDPAPAYYLEKMRANIDNLAKALP